MELLWTLICWLLVSAVCLLLLAVAGIISCFTMAIIFDYIDERERKEKENE